MTPIGHFAAGLAGKRFGKKIHLGILLSAAWVLDILYLLFAFTGIEGAVDFNKPGTAPCPWSHGLFMALVWSALAGLVAWRAYRSRPAGMVIGLVAFSHWLLDFLMWNDLPLFFEGSPQVGLGLFNALGSSTIFIELGLFLIGFIVYWMSRKQATQPAVIPARS